MCCRIPCSTRKEKTKKVSGKSMRSPYGPHGTRMHHKVLYSPPYDPHTACIPISSLFFYPFMAFVHLAMSYFGFLLAWCSFSLIIGMPNIKRLTPKCPRNDVPPFEEPIFEYMWHKAKYETLTTKPFGTIWSIECDTLKTLWLDRKVRRMIS